MDEIWDEQIPDSGMWLPKDVGSWIEGECIGISTGAYGKQITLRKGDNETVTTPSHKVLQSRINHVQVGDIVKIEYLGMELPKVKGQQGARLYKVMKRRPYTEEEVKDA